MSAPRSKAHTNQTRASRGHPFSVTVATRAVRTSPRASLSGAADAARARLRLGRRRHWSMSDAAAARARLRREGRALNTGEARRHPQRWETPENRGLPQRRGIVKESSPAATPGNRGRLPCRGKRCVIKAALHTGESRPPSMTGKRRAAA